VPPPAAIRNRAVHESGWNRLAQQLLLDLDRLPALDDGATPLRPTFTRSTLVDGATSSVRMRATHQRLPGGHDLNSIET